jgi:ParB-like chromosome segregation protein Spo0J
MAEKSRGASRIERIGVETLLPYAKNSRTHSDEQVAQIAASIKEFGFNNPILIDKENTIIAGHGRLLAARRAGMVDVPCIRLDHLTETQRKAYVIADNRLALNAGWDNEMLALEMGELAELGFDLDLTAFTKDEVAALQTPDFDAATEEDQGKLDQLDPKWIACPNCGKEFDVRQA